MLDLVNLITHDIFRVRVMILSHKTERKLTIFSRSRPFLPSCLFTFQSEVTSHVLLNQSADWDFHDLMNINEMHDVIPDVHGFEPMSGLEIFPLKLNLFKKDEEKGDLDIFLFVTVLVKIDTPPPHCYAYFP